MVTVLDLDILYYPCPRGSPNFRPMVTQMGGKQQFPYMVCLLHPNDFFISFPFFPPKPSMKVDWHHFSHYEMSLLMFSVNYTIFSFNGRLIQILECPCMNQMESSNIYPRNMVGFCFSMAFLKISSSFHYHYYSSSTTVFFFSLMFG